MFGFRLLFFEGFFFLVIFYTVYLFVLCDNNEIHEAEQDVKEAVYFGSEGLNLLLPFLLAEP